jgi:hypothetical protein
MIEPAAGPVLMRVAAGGGPHLIPLSVQGCGPSSLERRQRRMCCGWGPRLSPTDQPSPFACSFRCARSARTTIRTGDRWSGGGQRGGIPGR